MDLDDVLNGQEPEGIDAPEAQPEAQAPEPQPAAEPSTPRDEQGRFAPKGEQTPATPEAAPPAAETTPDPKGIAAALAEERRKRQEIERQLQDLQSRPAQPPAQTQQQERPEFIPNPVDDPQGFYDAVMAEAEQRALDRLMPQFQQQIGQTRIETLRSFAASKYSDFAEVEAEYLELRKTNPGLAAEVAQASNPVERAYELTKGLLEIRKVGSMDIEAIKAAAVQEYLAKNPAPAAAPQPLPTSLADAQSSRSSASTGAAAPPTLDQILGR